MYLDSNLYGYVINNIPFERELIRLQNNSILSTIWLPVHEIIHTIEYYSISKGYITWEFHNAIVQYGHSIDNWMYYDIYNPYLNGSKNPENNVEFGIVEEIWINPPGLEERD